MATNWSYVGAYAWVENLVPQPPPETVTLADGRQVRRQAHNGGFVHAPSMAHAAAAAVMRSAYLSHRDQSPAQRYRYAFDLTSRRVRSARAVLDGVRTGQSIGALLGYRFERFLHEHALERFIDPFRKAYPLLANKSGDPDRQTAAAPPRDVSDGLALRTDWRDSLDSKAPSPLTKIEVSPPPTDAERATLEKGFGDLDQAVDGVSDLLTAESVYQLIRGNVAAAGAPLEALAAGARPPDPGVGRTPRGGTPATHRLLWLSSQDAVQYNWQGTKSTARAAAEPIVDRWLGEVLGDPAAVLCWVSDAGRRLPVSLAQLGLRPVDALELARAAPAAPRELERRIVDAAFAGAPSPDAVIHYEPEPDDGFDPAIMRTIPEFLEAARHVSAALAQARPLAASDFRLLGGEEETFDSGLVANEVAGASATRDQVAAVQAALDTAIGTGEPAAIRQQLRRAAEIQAEAYPLGADDPKLIDQARAVSAELGKRIALATEALSSRSPDTPLDQSLEASRAAYKALFGQSFIRASRFVLPTTTRDELGDIEKRSERLHAADPDAADRLIHHVARIRPAVASWGAMWMFAQAIVRAGGPPGARTRPWLSIAQLPYSSEEAWVGGTIGAEARLSGSRLSLLIHRSNGESFPDFSQPVAGLVIDEWIELIPNREEQTGVALHFDRPGAEAAQAIFIAVPPDEKTSAWSFEQLTAALAETLELAKLRALEPEMLGDWGQIMPAIYLSASSNRQQLAGSDDQLANAADDVSTRFDGLLVGETVIK